MSVLIACIGTWWVVAYGNAGKFESGLCLTANLVTKHLPNSQAYSQMPSTTTTGKCAVNQEETADNNTIEPSIQ